MKVLVFIVFLLFVLLFRSIREGGPGDNDRENITETRKKLLEKYAESDGYKEFTLQRIMNTTSIPSRDRIAIEQIINLYKDGPTNKKITARMKSEEALEVLERIN